MDEIPIRVAVPALVTTQLLAAEVYSEFLRLSSDGERELWGKMLDDELDHVDYLRRVLRKSLPDSLTFPHVNVVRMRETCDQVKRAGEEFFLLRLEGALRLECAELDFGLEGLVARRLAKNELLDAYPGDIAEHINFLLHEAERYAESPNIRLQMLRLGDLLEAGLADTKVIDHDRAT